MLARSGWRCRSCSRVGSRRACGADIGQIKVSKGQRVDRARGPIAARRRGNAAAGLRTSSTTGDDGSVGITMTDNSLLSAGPNSVLALDRYEFDSTTNAGPLRCVAATRHARRRVGPAREAVAGCDDACARRRRCSACAAPNSWSRRDDEPRTRSRASSPHRGRRVAGCALAHERIVLLPEQDGRATAVIVRQGGREVMLDQPYAARSCAYADPWSYRASDSRSAGDVQGRARRAAGRAAHFTLYFVEDKDELTEDSKTVFESVFAD